MRHLLTLLAIVLTASLIACDNNGSTETSATAPGGDTQRTITIGLVAKSQGNAVFQIARKGAEDAAAALGDKYDARVVIDWQTPPDEDAQAQAQAIEQLAISGADGIIVSCSDAQTLTSAINKALARGVPVITFDSDAPDSDRFAFYGNDDLDCGQRVAQALAEAMNNQGNVAILAGNAAAPNLQKRREGVLQVLHEIPGINVLDTVYHNETPEDAATAVNQAQNSTTPTIDGWAFIGGWPLFTKNALRWEPGSVKVVSVDALPPMIEYLKSGHVEVLLAQDCYGWGYKTTEMMLEKVVNDKEPEQERIIAPLTPVTTENADAYLQQWAEWLGD